MVLDMFSVKLLLPQTVDFGDLTKGDLKKFMMYVVHSLGSCLNHPHPT